MNVELQVIGSALRAVAEEMGAVLVRSAFSANIKERRDCSTALFDPAGELVMQAEHIPVHLGSMPDAVAAVLGEEQRPERSWILNDPYRGGTHLPDITLVAPVFAGEWRDTPILRGEPAAGTEAEGPVVFELPEATFVVPPGWSTGVDRHGTIIACSLLASSNKKEQRTDRDGR